VVEIKKIVNLLILVFSFVFCMGFVVYAEISYDMDETPSFKKTITWYSSKNDAEYRYLPGTMSEDFFSSATPAGSGGSASITVESNGIYTLFARVGEDIQMITVPVVTIDRTSPVITLEHVIRNSDGTVDIGYNVSDYFGVSETRIASGSQTVSAFGGASTISGGSIHNISPGRYTIFAKDIAGNISVYPLTVDAQAEEWLTQHTEHEEWSTEWSTEWGSNWIQYDYEIPQIILISKCDITNGKELPGAHLEISDLVGSLITSWVTTGKQTQIKNALEPGKTYVLTEKIAPDGYEIAESITFTVKNDGSVTHVIMYDSPKDKPGHPEEPTETPVPGTVFETDSVPAVPSTPVERMPQTGGVNDARVLSVIGGGVLTLFGSVAFFYRGRKKEQ